MTIFEPCPKCGCTVSIFWKNTTKRGRILSIQNPCRAATKEKTVTYDSVVFEKVKVGSIQSLYTVICIVIEFSSSFILTISLKYTVVSNSIGWFWDIPFLQTLFASISCVQFLKMQKAPCISRWSEKIAMIKQGKILK